MSECDIIVACSRLEAFGRVGVEAMLLGKPFVFSRAGGFLEYMVEGVTGLSYVPGDIKHLASQLDLLISNPMLRKSMGNSGSQRAKDIFSRKRFSKLVYAAMREVQARGRIAQSMPKCIEDVIVVAGALKPES
jgi:glycosyltransferase involved in cell wall biosynthesis